MSYAWPMRRNFNDDAWMQALIDKISYLEVDMKLERRRLRAELARLVIAVAMAFALGHCWR